MAIEVFLPFWQDPPIVLIWTRSIKFTLSYRLSLRSILILSSHIHLRLPSGLFLSCFPMRTPHAPLFSHVCATCRAHLIVHYFIIRVKFGGDKNVNPWHACKRTDGMRSYSTSPFATSVLDRGGCSVTTPRLLYCREIPGRHHTGCGVTLGAVVNGHKEFRFHRDSILGHQSRSESLYRLCYSGRLDTSTYSKFSVIVNFTRENCAQKWIRNVSDHYFMVYSRLHR